MTTPAHENPPEAVNPYRFSQYRIGFSPVMSERSPNDAKDLHWPIFDDQCGCVAHVFGQREAKIFASAPALLAALQGLLTLRYFKGVEEMRGTTIAKIAVEKLDAARAALALATGGVK